jgi:putative transposase
MRQYTASIRESIYMVTAATLHKEHLFVGTDRLDLLEHELLSLAKQYEWQLQAWAAFSNHYHFVGRSHEEKFRLKEFLSHLHSNAGRELEASLWQHCGRNK